MIIALMGVSGSGKSTLGRALAAKLGWDFIEGDEFHPPENVEKMRRGEPLDDEDRAPWLDALHRQLCGAQHAARSAVLACSALRRHYRTTLAAGIKEIRFVYLHGSNELIRRRLGDRVDHFMPPRLLETQLEALEPPSDAIKIDVALTTARQVDMVTRALSVGPAAGDAPPEQLRCNTLIDGLAFPESPRWREGRLWFTDQHAQRIYAVDPEGVTQVIAETDDLPGGLGWLPDDSLLVVYMTQRRIMRLVAGELVEYADLSQHASFHCNDLVVDVAGNIYAGNFGFDLHAGADVTSAELIRVDTAGQVSVFASDLVFPNGSVITPDGDTLLVAETFGHRITAFGLASDGSSTGAQTWADLDGQTPDGICLDAEGAVWVASPGTRALTRVKKGGAVLDHCRTRGTPYACMLGGPDRRTLYVCTSETDDPDRATIKRSGRIEQTRVEIPGAGRP